MSQPSDEVERLPIDPRTGRPIAPHAQPGYYPGFSTLAQQDYWDAATRQVIRQRVEDVPPIRFFTADETRLMDVLSAHLLPQDDRDEAHRIPIVPFIDERLHLGRTPGYRYASMPPDPEAYRLGFQAIEQMAQANHDSGFLALDWLQQEALLQSIHDQQPIAGAEVIWQRMPIERWWLLLLHDCIEVYYAHPWAWDEIGFGGPAYPRGYLRLNHGEPEPWEVDETRHEWVLSPRMWLSDPRPDEVANPARQQPAAAAKGTC